MADEPQVNGGAQPDDDADVGEVDAAGADAKPLEGLTPRQSQAVLALAGEPTLKKASEATGIPERTLYRWRQIPAFKAALHLVQRESFSQATAMLVRYAPHAVQVLGRLMTDISCPHATRAAAASTILKTGRESINLEELVLRIEALEKAAKVQAGPRLAR